MKWMNIRLVALSNKINTLHFPAPLSNSFLLYKHGNKTNNSKIVNCYLAQKESNKQIHVMSRLHSIKNKMLSRKKLKLNL